MRLLHTGDWHLGKRLYGADRTEEAGPSSRRSPSLAEAEAVDAVLVSGDLLDRRVVDSAALGACLRALERLAETAPVLAVAGNHDDADLWDPPRAAPGGLGIHVAATCARGGGGRDGAHGGRACCTPRCCRGRSGADRPRRGRQRRVRPVPLRGPVADVIDDYAAGGRRAAAAGRGGRRGARGPPDGGAGGRAGGGERELTMGIDVCRSPPAAHAARPGLRGPGARPPAQEIARRSRRPAATAGARWPSTSARTTTQDRVPRGGGRRPARRARSRSGRPAPGAAARAARRPGRARLGPPGRVVRVRGQLDGPAMDVVRRVREAVPGALRVEAALPRQGRRASPEPGGAPRTTARGLPALYASGPPAGPPAGAEQAAAFGGARGSGPAAAGDEGRRRAPLELELTAFRSYDRATDRPAAARAGGHHGRHRARARRRCSTPICFALFGRTPEQARPRELLTLGRTHGEVRLTVLGAGRGVAGHAALRPGRARAGAPPGAAR